MTEDSRIYEIHKILDEILTGFKPDELKEVDKEIFISITNNIDTIDIVKLRELSNSFELVKRRDMQVLNNGINDLRETYNNIKNKWRDEVRNLAKQISGELDDKT